jgi:hypothetical protein
MMVRIRGLKIPISLDIKPKFCSCQEKKPKFCSFGYHKYDISLFQILTLSILNSVTCFFTIVSHLSDIDSNFYDIFNMENILEMWFIFIYNYDFSNTNFNPSIILLLNFFGSYKSHLFNNDFSLETKCNS